MHWSLLHHLQTVSVIDDVRRHPAGRNTHIVTTHVVMIAVKGLSATTQRAFQPMMDILNI